MADFDIAYKITSKWEGGYVNDPDDKGGETIFGISRKHWPDWKGWDIVDQLKPLKKGDKPKSEQLLRLVKEFYRVNFWQKMKGEYINNQAIANMVYDWYVNSGINATKWIQKVVGTTPDGIIGPATLREINSGCQEDIFNQYKAARLHFYDEIVKDKPSQRKFLDGWRNRTNDIVF